MLFGRRTGGTQQEENNYTGEKQDVILAHGRVVLAHGKVDLAHGNVVLAHGSRGTEGVSYTHGTISTGAGLAHGTFSAGHSLHYGDPLANACARLPNSSPQHVVSSNR